MPWARSAMFLIFWGILLIFSDGVFLRSRSPIRRSLRRCRLPFCWSLRSFSRRPMARSTCPIPRPSAWAHLHSPISQTGRSNPEVLQAWDPGSFRRKRVPGWASSPRCWWARLVGLFNSFLVLRFRLTPFIATLGVQFFMRGLIVILSDAKSIPLPFIGHTRVLQGVLRAGVCIVCDDSCWQSNPDNGFIQFFGTLAREISEPDVVGDPVLCDHLGAV